MKKFKKGYEFTFLSKGGSFTYKMEEEITEGLSRSSKLYKEIKPL